MSASLSPSSLPIKSASAPCTPTVHEQERHISYSATPKIYDDATPLSPGFFCHSPVSTQFPFTSSPSLTPPPLVYDPPRRPTSHLFDRLTNYLPSTPSRTPSLRSQYSQLAGEGTTWYDALSQEGAYDGFVDTRVTMMDDMPIWESSAVSLHRPFSLDDYDNDSEILAPEELHKRMRDSVAASLCSVSASEACEFGGDVLARKGRAI